MICVVGILTKEQAQEIAFIMKLVLVGNYTQKISQEFRRDQAKKAILREAGGMLDEK